MSLLAGGDTVSHVVQIVLKLKILPPDLSSGGFNGMSQTQSMFPSIATVTTWNLQPEIRFLSLIKKRG